LVKTTAQWKRSACILCECNCGIDVQTGSQDGREIVCIRGDKTHPALQGYLRQKSVGSQSLPVWCRSTDVSLAAQSLTPIKPSAASIA